MTSSGSDKPQQVLPVFRKGAAPEPGQYFCNHFGIGDGNRNTRLLHRKPVHETKFIILTYQIFNDQSIIKIPFTIALLFSALQHPEIFPDNME
jgi:hypothetical protein